MTSPSPYSVRDAVAEDKSTIRPGQTLVFWYNDDNVWYERIAPWPEMTPFQPPTCWVSTLDLDMYPEQLDLDGEQAQRRGPRDPRRATTMFR